MTMLTIDNKRQSPRHKVLKDGKVVFNNNWSVVDCCIRDVSETGARLRCKDHLAIPQQFKLLVVVENVIRDCEVRWRRGDEIGVHFTSEAKRAPPRKW